MIILEPVAAVAPIVGRLQELDFDFARPPFHRQPSAAAITLGPNLRAVVKRFDYSAAQLSFEDGAGAHIAQVPEGLAVFETLFHGGGTGLTRNVVPLIRLGSTFGLSSQADYDIVFNGETVLQMREQRSWKMYKKDASE